MQAEVRIGVALALVSLAMLAPGSAGAAECPKSVTSSELDAVLDRAERAFETLEVEGFGFAVDEAALMVPCLADAVTPALAARYHLVHGLGRFVRRDQPGAERSFAASRDLVPGARLPTDLVPEGHAIRGVWSAVDTEGEFEDLDDPQLLFDGRPRRRPLSWPTLAQRVDGPRAVESRWLDSGQPLPWEAAASPTTPATQVLPPPQRPTTPARTGLTPVTVAGLVAAGVGVTMGTATWGATRAKKTGWTTGGRDAVIAFNVVGWSTGAIGLGLAGAGLAGVGSHGGSP